MKTFACTGLKKVWYSFYYFKNPTSDYISHQLMDFKAQLTPQIKTFCTLVKKHFQSLDLRFDYVARVLGHDELTPTAGAKVIPIAKAIVEVTGAKYIPKLLKKNRKTRPLKGLGLAARQAELDGVYEFGEEVDLNKKKILIVDDISTTGTSFEVIAELIKSKYPAAEVYGYCLGKTVSLQFNKVSKNEQATVDEYEAELANHKKK